MPGARDYFGKEIHVGDTVVFVRPAYREFIHGKVTKITECFCFIDYESLWSKGHITDVNQKHRQVVVVDPVTGKPENNQVSA